MEVVLSGSIVSQILKQSKAALRNKAIHTPELDAELLLMHVLECSREALLLKKDQRVTDEEYQRYQRVIQRRLAYEPVSKIIGRRDFWKHEFDVSADVLDPRPDSETLIEAVLELMPNHKRPIRILDLGTGSGCLILSLLHEYANASGVMVDKSEAAIRIAMSNALKLGLAKRVVPIVGCWHACVETCFDLVISNPPYIASADSSHLAKEVLHYDPHLSLFGGKDGLECYQDISINLKDKLAPDALVCFEVGVQQHADVRAICQFSGLNFEGYRQDIAGIPRCVIMRNN